MSSCLLQRRRRDRKRVRTSPPRHALISVNSPTIVWITGLGKWSSMLVFRACALEATPFTAPAIAPWMTLAGLPQHNGTLPRDEQSWSGFSHRRQHLHAVDRLAGQRDLDGPERQWPVQPGLDRSRIGGLAGSGVEA